MVTKVSVVSQQSANPGTMSVALERTYQSSTEPDSEVSATERVKGYRYGKTLVPFAQTDESLLKYTSTSCLKVIGFTSSKNVPSNNYIFT
jgi:ATP-dependent DNA helicase 2 subunit 2